MSHRNRSQFDSLHLAKGVRQRVQLRLHLAGARSVEPAALDAALDEAVDEESQLERQRQAVVLMALETDGQQAGIDGVEDRGAVLADLVAGGPQRPGGAPFGAQVVLDGVGQRHQELDGALDVLLLVRRQRPRRRVAVGQNRADEIADARVDCLDAVAPVPEAVVRGLVPEDEHQTDDDGEGGYLFRTVSKQRSK